MPLGRSANMTVRHSLLCPILSMLWVRIFRINMSTTASSRLYLLTQLLWRTCWSKYCRWHRVLFLNFIISAFRYACILARMTHIIINSSNMTPQTCCQHPTKHPQMRSYELVRSRIDSSCNRVSTQCIEKQQKSRYRGRRRGKIQKMFVLENA